MSYFPTDIPFVSEEELKENGIKVNCSEKPNGSNLRSCPFCGKEAKVCVYGHAAKTRRMDGEGPYFAATYRIGCFDCGVIFTHESQFEAKEDGSIEVVINGYKIATDKWNRRNEE